MGSKSRKSDLWIMSGDCPPMEIKAVMKGELLPTQVRYTYASVRCGTIMCKCANEAIGQALCKLPAWHS